MESIIEHIVFALAFFIESGGIGFILSIILVLLIGRLIMTLTGWSADKTGNVLMLSGAIGILLIVLFG